MLKDEQANHCPGSVMFLIEDKIKAVLYTGDIRSERWWVGSLARNPLIVPYVSGLRRLDRIYLDTTFGSSVDLQKEFPSKAKGIQELLSKVVEYPEDTMFHINSWTFGYEEVWVALSSFLDSPVSRVIMTCGGSSPHTSQPGQSTTWTVYFKYAAVARE